VGGAWGVGEGDWGRAAPGQDESRPPAPAPRPPPAESRIANSEFRLSEVVRERGPLTVAAFMELALYDPQCGYYARAARRSGRAGDFFTSVDVGPLFGELFELQIAETASMLAAAGTESAESVENAEILNLSANSKKVAESPDQVPQASRNLPPHPKKDSPDSAFSAVAFPQSPVPSPQSPRVFDLVEAGAGNGRLAADILHAAQQRHPGLFASIRLHLVEASASARATQRSTLRDASDRLASPSPTMPHAFECRLIAHELPHAPSTAQV